MTEIRALTEADIDAVAAVHVRAWQTAYAGLIPDDYLGALDPAALAARRRSGSHPGQTVVAVDDGTIVGFASFGRYRDDPASGTGELYAIYVDPDRTGRGVGRLLLAAAKEGLTAAGFPAVRLWVLEENHRARRFYERAGLRPDGARQNYTPRGTTIEVPEVRYATDL